MEEVRARCKPGDLVCDAFSGSLAVSLELKRQGYRVAANDINYLSYVYGNALISNNSIPVVPIELLLPKEFRADCMTAARSETNALIIEDGFGFLRSRHHRTRFVRLVALLRYLELCPDCSPVGDRNSFIFDTYCESGCSSSFVSLRGTGGRRRFFSEANARRLDIILSQLRSWYQRGAVSETLLNLVLCSVLDGTERVANTQGTYHDFPRKFYDPRSLNSLRLRPPALDRLIGLRQKHYVGRGEDTLQFIKRVPPHKLIYIDPPYNFRQYTAYYFLPNVIAKYPVLDNLDEYFGNVEYVRGQNMSDDFTSTFCKTSQFVESLRLLIERARTDWVVLSYFDGKNHWNDFKLDSNGAGFEVMEEFFTSELFDNRSLEVVPFSRQNYQSYGGYKAKEVQEWLFVARKASSAMPGLTKSTSAVTY